MHLLIRIVGPVALILGEILFVPAVNAGEPSNLYNTDFLPAGVREQLEAARDGKQSTQYQETQRQIYDQVLNDSGSQPQPSAPASNSTLDALDAATRLLEVFQQNSQQRQNSAPREEYRQPPPANYDNPQYRAPANSGYAAPAQDNRRYPPPVNAAPPPVDTSYRQNPLYRPPPGSANNAPAATYPVAPSPASPAPPECPAGTQKNPEMAALGLASCCTADGQCF